MFVYKVPKCGINATGTKEHLPNQSWCEVCGGVLQIFDRMLWSSSNSEEIWLWYGQASFHCLVCSVTYLILMASWSCTCQNKKLKNCWVSSEKKYNREFDLSGVFEGFVKGNNSSSQCDLLSVLIHSSIHLLLYSLGWATICCWSLTHFLLVEKLDF